MRAGGRAAIGGVTDRRARGGGADGHQLRRVIGSRGRREGGPRHLL